MTAARLCEHRRLSHPRWPPARVPPADRGGGEAAVAGSPRLDVSDLDYGHQLDAVLVRRPSLDRGTSKASTIITGVDPDPPKAAELCCGPHPGGRLGGLVVDVTPWARAGGTLRAEHRSRPRQTR